MPQNLVAVIKIFRVQFQAGGNGFQYFSTTRMNAPVRYIFLGKGIFL
jgi:hypothetical protein